MDFRRQAAGGGTFGLTGPVPRDVWILLAVVVGTFSLRFFTATAPLAATLRLGWEAVAGLRLWQLATYPFAGTGVPGLWFVVELLILFLFARQVLYQLGRRRFWRLLVGVALAAAAVALAVEALARAVGPGSPTPFVLMQGQHMLLAILVAAFATLNQHATILLFFVLPVQARWFLLLEVFFAFLGFLTTHDLGGLAGVCAAVGATYLTLASGAGGVRQLRLALEERWLRFRLGRLKKRRQLKVIRGRDSDPWVH